LLYSRYPTMAGFALSLRSLILAIYVALCSAYSALSDSSLKSIQRPGSAFDIHTGSILAPILIPRVSGTRGNERVRDHFANFFSKELPQWKVTYQNSTSKTPATGDRDIPFVNLIATRDPPWATPGEVSYLTLVAHYDSKMTPPGFIGATDSAAPCAMILYAAKQLEEALSKKWDAMKSESANDRMMDSMSSKGLQIILLDGEEAFKSWTSTDSIYGARSLAAEWETTPHPALSTYSSPLAAIELFLLLDLLGAKDPKVPSYFKTTHWAYQNLAKLEERMRGLDLLHSSPNHKSKREKRKSNVDKRVTEPSFFFEREKKDSDRWMGGMIEDDHIPFQARGVEVLHIIPTPFPRVWHKGEDDGGHLHMETVEDWAVLVTAFAGEWMELDDHLHSIQGRDMTGVVRDEL
jgi:glutaminyl-peptide cyclotransferase